MLLLLYRPETSVGVVLTVNDRIVPYFGVFRLHPVCAVLIPEDCLIEFLRCLLSRLRHEMTVAI